MSGSLFFDSEEPKLLASEKPEPLLHVVGALPPVAGVPGYPVVGLTRAPLATLHLFLERHVGRYLADTRRRSVICH